MVASNGPAPPPAAKPANPKQNGSGFLSTLGQAGSHVLRSLGGDGLTNSEAAARSDGQPKDLLATLHAQLEAHSLGKDASTILQIALSAGKPLDDRKMLLEKVVGMLQNAPPDSPFGTQFANLLITQLWNELNHPPLNYVGPNAPPPTKDEFERPIVQTNLNEFAGPLSYRRADSAMNSVLDPTMGRSMMPYARTVGSSHPMPNNLPEPSVVFDALLKRDHFEPHPSGISSLLFAFATAIIHSCFQTNHVDRSLNEASSYLDLSPLYGNNITEQKTVRSNENGLLYPDVIASTRLFMMVPSVCALMIVFSRNHNYIATKLFQINEKGTYKPWKELSAAQKVAQDEELFQKARLVNCGWFLNVIFQDYIRVILNINRSTSTWSLNPNGPINTLNGPLERGVGNAVSVEFNLLYRWHATISAKDEAWLNALMKSILPAGVTPKNVTAQQFGQAAKDFVQNKLGPDPRTWRFDGLERDSKTNMFSDDDLVRILKEATEEVAGAFKARGSPAAMRVIDIMGIATARNEWNICSLNEFRKFLKLKTYDTFQEWNEDPVISSIAEKLYGHPDNLELFVGMHAEQPKPSMEGSGLAPGYTISRAILSDAAALVRGDRYFTTDLSTQSLTCWGFEDVTPNTKGGSFGGVIGSLLMRTFPNHYRYNSIYAHFPFSTHTTTRQILNTLNLEGVYDTTAPKEGLSWKTVRSMQACTSVMSDTMRYSVAYGPHASVHLLDKFGFRSTGEKLENDVKMVEETFFSPGWEAGVSDYFSRTTKRLLQENAFSLDSNRTFSLDIVRDVLNLVSAEYVSQMFGIPLKTADEPLGVFSSHEFYRLLSTVYQFAFCNLKPEGAMALEQAAIDQTSLLKAVIDMRLLEAAHVPEKIGDLISESHVLFGCMTDIRHFVDAKVNYKRLISSKRDSRAIEAVIMAVCAATCANFGQAASQVVHFYLQAECKSELKDIVSLAKRNDPVSEKKLLGYILEAMRLDLQLTAVLRVATADGNLRDKDADGKECSLKVKKGDWMVLSARLAGKDAMFPEAEKINPARANMETLEPLLFGVGPHKCLGANFHKVALLATVKEVFKLPNLRLDSGSNGTLRRFMEPFAETHISTYVTATGDLSPFPQSLGVKYSK